MFAGLAFLFGRIAALLVVCRTTSSSIGVACALVMLTTGLTAGCGQLFEVGGGEEALLCVRQ